MTEKSTTVIAEAKTEEKKTLKVTRTKKAAPTEEKKVAVKRKPAVRKAAVKDETTEVKKAPAKKVPTKEVKETKAVEEVEALDKKDENIIKLGIKHLTELKELRTVDLEELAEKAGFAFEGLFGLY